MAALRRAFGARGEELAGRVLRPQFRPMIVFENLGAALAAAGVWA